MSTSRAAHAVRTERLTKTYRAVTALVDLDLEVAAGEILGYLGPNGAGKTTTIRLLLGMINPSRGGARIFGLDCHRQPVEVHRRIAYVSGEPNLWPGLTGGETLDLLGRVQGWTDAAYRAELVEMFNLDPTCKVRTYSKGNRQKVLLIAALMSRADLLLLDEPTAGLDPLMEQTFRGCVRTARERGQTVFLSSHVLSEVEAVCDRVAILREGRLVEIGTLEEMRHLSALAVEATFSSRAPDVSGTAGVSAVEVAGNVLRCHVTGSIEPLLEAVAGRGVVKLTSREPSLEELFLSQYGSTGAETGTHVPVDREPRDGPPESVAASRGLEPSTHDR